MLDEQLTRELGTKLVEKGYTIATAESCTAGGISSFIASISGASRYLKGGVVSYFTEVKENVLNVPKKLIEQYDVVSKEVAQQMAIGVRHLLDSDIAIGITGYAGLTGGNSKVPNGTVWICAINGNNGNQALRELHVNEERKRNLEICVEEAVKLALEVI